MRPGARRGYRAVVRYDNHADRPAWRVTSGEPAPGAVERLLRLLPGWFGIESSVLEYVADARARPAYQAWPDGQQAAEPSGVLLAARHFSASAEIYQAVLRQRRLPAPRGDLRPLAGTPLPDHDQVSQDGQATFHR